MTRCWPTAQRPGTPAPGTCARERLRAWEGIRDDHRPHHMERAAASRHGPSLRWLDGLPYTRTAQDHMLMYEEILTTSPGCGAWMNWPPPM